MSIQATHWDDCWKSGPAHYECAVGKANRLISENALLRGDLAGANRECEVLRGREFGHMARAEKAEAAVERLRAERVITAPPWRYQEWGGLVVGGGEGSAEVLICTMATNTRHDEGRHNRELIIEAPTLRARLDKAEAEVERLRADADRLDWLVQEIRLPDLMRLLLEWNGDFATIRAAIDAARGES